ncbi:hypothetical protein [Mycobacterium riyadhense]|uniref:hypothetical protein n=1 Tax=Mycobacterium riyadhense TaxID=486698 RepID=UPI002095AC76|nr:hypothetical protein [Mycobacterium riyadhense]
MTAARAEYNWLAAGSQTVQQQALRDFAQAMRSCHGVSRLPTAPRTDPDETSSPC